jgi:simple sugar transport system permease protein
MNVITSILHLMTQAPFWQSALEAAALLLLPALGGVISERSGVVNIAMEGMMLTGAFVSVVTDLAWHSPWLAALAAMIAGGLMALIHAVVSIRYHADQIVSGIAINVLASGLTLFLVNVFFHLTDVGHVEPQNLLPIVSVTGLNGIPVVGFLAQIFLQQNVIFYVAVAGLFGVHFLLFRTKLGLRIRAVGEHPSAADTAGINVYRIRYGAVIASGLLSGLGGAYLAIGLSNTFVQNMTEGRGYIALAAMIFGKWTPFGAFVACLIFGVGQAIFNNNSTLPVSPYFLNMLPYILTIIVLAGLVGRSTPPAADGLPYEPGVE